MPPPPPLLRRRQALPLGAALLLLSLSCRSAGAFVASPRSHLAAGRGGAAILQSRGTGTSRPDPSLGMGAASSAASLAGRIGLANPASRLDPATQAGLVLSSAALLASYHICLLAKERGSVQTWRKFQADTREEWSRHVRETEGWLYAVQTLRNAITAQTFLATTVLSLLTLITGRMWDILRVAKGVQERRLLTGQLVGVAAPMLFSAYYFLQGVRLMTHAAFMFPVAQGSTRVDRVMRTSQSCQWLGLRWMYVSLGPIAWVVGGPRALFAVSFALLSFFRGIDRQPKGMGYEEFQGGGI